VLRVNLFIIQLPFVCQLVGHCITGQLLCPQVRHLKESIVRQSHDEAFFSIEFSLSYEDWGTQSFGGPGCTDVLYNYNCAIVTTK